MKTIIYEPHPVSVERKKELTSNGYKIIDAKFKPVESIQEDLKPKKTTES